MAQLSKYVDFFTVMSYDYHGSWETVTGHVSPLYGDDSDKYPQYNTDYALQLLVKMGAEKEKLVVGIPFYGQVRLSFLAFVCPKLTIFYPDNSYSDFHISH